MAKVLKEYRLSGPDGVYDIECGDASLEARMQRDFSKTGKAVKAAEGRAEAFDDVKMLGERFGFPVSW